MLHTYEVEPYVTVVPDERLFGEAMEHTKRVRLHLATKAGLNHKPGEDAEMTSTAFDAGRRWAAIGRPQR